MAFMQIVHMQNPDTLSVTRKQTELGMQLWTIWESPADGSLYDGQDSDVHAD